MGYTKRKDFWGRWLVETIKENVRKLKQELSQGNAFGEKVSLVLATKMQNVERINAAIEEGVDAVAENRVQEFRDKTDSLLPCPQHFIGHLQTNKVKYLVGKIDLFHSCDRDDLATEIARQSMKKGIVSNVLIQVNAGEESSKGGYSPAEAREAFLRLLGMEGLCVRGFMAMLPHSNDEEMLFALASDMRLLFEWAKSQSANVEYLSMGMSGDYRLCIRAGSNMIRVGSTVFGERIYG